MDDCNDLHGAGKCVFFRLCHHPSHHCYSIQRSDDSGSTAKMKFDNILSEINGFGKFQIKLVLIQMLSRLSMPCHFLLNNFMAAVPSHHCDISSLDDGGIFRNLTMDQKLAVSIPAERDGSLSSCQMFLQPHYEHLSGSNSTDNTVIAECQTGWVYDNSTFKSTVVTEVGFNELTVKLLNVTNRH